MPINLLLDHHWMAILISTLVPPLLYAAIQYLRTGARFGFEDLWIALTIGLIPAVLLLSLTVSVLNRELDKTRPEAQISTISPISGNDGSIDPVPQEEAWHPNTVEQLMAKISGLTDVERRNAIKNDLGLLIEIEG